MRALRYNIQENNLKNPEVFVDDRVALFQFFLISDVAGSFWSVHVTYESHLDILG